VADLAFDDERRLDVDLGGIRTEIVELGTRDEAASLLRLCKRDPNGSP
jgi:hypothetical protein